MLVNIPTLENLNSVALSLYFAAWRDLIGMVMDFDRRADYLADDDQTAEMWKEYLEVCQSELVSIVTTIQQSNEIALKARICAVSPFALLLGTELRFGAEPKPYDFSEFRTVDAVDLPRTVNALCAAPVSAKYQSMYHELRVLRNRIAHLGTSGVTLDPNAMLRTLARQYLELWSERRWLADYAEFATATRSSFFYDYKHYTPQDDCFYGLPTSFKVFTKSEFKNLFGADRNKRRFRCHHCLEETGRGFPAGDSQYYTAVLNEDGDSLRCFFCDRTFAVKRTKCDQDKCKSTVASADEIYESRCHLCGEYVGEANMTEEELQNAWLRRHTAQSAHYRKMMEGPKRESVE